MYEKHYQIQYWELALWLNIRKTYNLIFEALTGIWYESYTGLYDDERSMLSSSSVTE